MTNEGNSKQRDFSHNGRGHASPHIPGTFGDAAAFAAGAYPENSKTVNSMNSGKEPVTRRSGRPESPRTGASGFADRSYRPSGPMC